MPSPNPTGRPRNLITAHDVSILFQKLALLTEEEITERTQDKSSSVMERGAAVAWLSYMQTGDYGKVRDLMEHMVGKVPTQTINESIVTSTEVLKGIPTETLLSLVEANDDKD